MIGSILTVLIILSFFLFVFVILFGAPFLPTLKERIVDVIEISNLKPGQTLLELGSGDGRILLEVAKKGIYGIGYELNPILVVYSKIKLWKYRKFVKIKWRNYWLVRLPKADVVFVFLLQKYMEKLSNKITQEYPHGVKLVSFAFKIDSKKPSAELNGIYLYKYNKRLKK